MNPLRFFPWLLGLLSFLQLPMASAQEYYHTQDFTADSLFTSGIEGPAVDQEGILYAVNFGESGTIGKVSPEGEASLYVRLPKGSTGNGLRFDPEGNMYVADYTGHQILKVSPDKDITVLGACEGCNQPNDLAIAPNGMLYLSDPNWQESTGQIWRMGHDGALTLLAENMGTTNGIEVNPKGDRLYINESIQRQIWVYDLSPEGEISNKRMLAEFPDFGFDGMRCDVDGNLYVTRYGKGSVVKLAPDGRVLLEVYLKGQKPSNIAFGGPDGKTAYVTLQDRGCVETFRVSQPGRAWKMWEKAKKDR